MGIDLHNTHDSDHSLFKGMGNIINGISNTFLDSSDRDISMAWYQCVLGPYINTLQEQHRQSHNGPGPTVLTPSPLQQRRTTPKARAKLSKLLVGS